MPSAGPFAFVSNNKNNSFPTTGPSSSVGESMLPLLSSIAAGMMPPPFGLNFLANSGMGKPPLNGQQQQQIQLLEALFKANILPPAPQEALKQVGIGEHLNNALTGVNRNRMANGLHQHSKADNDDIPSSIQQQQQQPYQQRKRRRMIGNLDNTLDGLVAKKADQMPLKKRYQTETEAIELPDDEVEIKRMEADPDVCTRMCSVCGYQGKWVSEMIRHKRVHTTERPFKCKYCNRTSKWKADLIRHVAKTHGIRVVSKYSRSKAFEMGKKDSNSGESEETGASMSMSMDDGEEDMMMADDDMVILDSSSSGSSDYGSAISWHQQDENNNDIEDGHHQIQTAQKVVNEVAAKGENGGADGESINSTVGIGHSDHLNSQYRKAQRLLNSIIGQRFSGQQQQQQIHSTTKVQPQQQHLQSAAAAAAAPSLLNLLALSNNFPPNLDSLNLAAQILLDQQQPKPAKPQPQQQQQKQNEYKCDFCPFEQISFPMLVSHLHAVHGIAPFICLNCHCSFNELVSAAEHFAQCSCPMTSLKSNFVLKNAIAEEEPQTRQHIGSTVPNGFINEHFSATLGQLSMLLSKPVASSVGGLFPSLAKCPPNNSQFATNAPVGNGENGCGSSPSSMLSTAASYSSLNSVEKHMHSNSNEMDPIEDHKTNGNGKQGGEKAKSPTVQAVGVFNKKMEEEEGHGSSSEIEVDEQKKMNKAHSGALDKMNIHHHREQFGGYSATDSAFIPLGGNSSSSSPIGINHKNNQRGWFPPCLNPGTPAAVTSLETFSKFLAELHKQTFAAQHSSMPTANGSSI